MRILEHFVAAAVPLCMQDAHAQSFCCLRYSESMVQRMGLLLEMHARLIPYCLTACTCAASPCIMGRTARSRM